MDLDGNKPWSSEQATRESPRIAELADIAGSLPRFSRIRFLFVLIGGIAMAEVIAMVVVYFFRHWPYYWQTLLDAALMVVLIFPLVYLFSLRPLLRHIEQRRQSEKRLRRVNRALLVLNQCNLLLVRAESESELLNRMCELLVNMGGYRMAWVGFAEQDENKSVRPVAQAGFEEGYFSRTQISWADTEHGRGPTGTAVRTGITQVNQDSFDDPLMTTWRESALEHGYQSSIAIPLMKGESAFGALTICSEFPNAFNLDEVSLLNELVNDLVYGIQAQRERIEHERAEQEAERRAKEWSETFDAMTEYVSVHDKDFRILRANRSLADLFGKKPEELVGQHCYELFHYSHQPWHNCPLAKAINTKSAVTEEVDDPQIGCPLLVGVSPILDSNDEVVGGIHIAKDISERKRAERDIELERNKLKNILDTMQEGVYIVNQDHDLEYVNPAVEREFGKINGRKCYQYFYDFPEACESCPNKIIFEGGIVKAERASLRTGKFYDLLHMPLHNVDGTVSKLTIMHDITHLKENEQALEQANQDLQNISQSEHHQRQLAEALARAAFTLNKSMKLHEVLPLILKQVKDVVPYQLADISLLEGESFYDAGHEGAPRWLASLVGVSKRFVLDEFPLLKNMCQSGQPVLIQDTEKEPDWVKMEGLESYRSFLSAPLLADKKVIGFVNLLADQPGFFSPEMRDHLVAFASHAAVAIRNAWLFEQVQAGTERLQSLSHRLVEVQESERLYISRELHDEAGQVLTSLLVDLRLLEKNVSKPKVVLKLATEMESSLNEVSESLHRIAMSLRPASLDQVGLVAALRQHVEAIREKHGLQASFKSEKSLERLPANVETTLYRIVQEALTNVVRHAHATRVDVVLTMRDNKLITIIEDDGVGFDPVSAANGEHLGLFGIQERVDMIGGKLAVESRPGQGTTIMVEVNHDDTSIDSRRS